MAQTASGYGISIICNMHYHYAYISHSQSVIYSPFYSPFPLHFLPYSLPCLLSILPSTLLSHYTSYPIHYHVCYLFSLLLSFPTTLPTLFTTILSPPFSLLFCSLLSHFFLPYSLPLPTLPCSSPLSFLTTPTLPCFSALSFPTTLPTILSPPSFARLLPPFPLHFLPYLLPYSPHPPYLPILRIAVYLFIFVFFCVPFMSCMHIEHACVL